MVGRVRGAAITHGVIWVLRWLASPGVDVTVFSVTENLCRVLVLVDVVWALTYTVWPRRAVATE